MCGVPDHLVSSGECQIGGYASSDGSAKSKLSDAKGMFESSISLLELAANNDLEGFKRAVENGGKVEDCGSWYCRKYGTNKTRWSQRTPAMIASLYGCKEVLKYILKHVSGHGGDANKGCDSDGVTALHCAAAGGSAHVLDIVNLLLSNGADPSSMDAQGLRPLDVMRVSSNIPHLKTTMEKLLNGSLKPGSPPPQGLSTSSLELDGCSLSGSLSSSKLAAAELENKIGLELGDSTCDAYPMSPLSLASFSTSPGAGGFFPSLASSPQTHDGSSIKASCDASEKKDSPADPSMIDIKNSIYTTDEFRMFAFKVCPCSRAYSHDWTECPFVHPGENARRRDPRRYHYSCVSCPDFRKGACRRGDACEYAHGVFECWLHPAQYRTRLCKDGISCSRRVCFFAHTTEELRPLYVSTGSAVPSSRTTSFLDVTSMSPPLGPTSPSSIVTLPPFTQLNTEQSGYSPTTSPLSTNSSIGNWIHPSVPTVNLSGVCFQSSRLKAVASARDVLPEDLGRPSGLEEQLMSEVTSLSTRARLNAALAASACGTTSSRAGKLWNMGLSVAPTNLEDLLASEVVLSPATPSQVSLQSRVDTQMQSNNSVHSPYHFKPLQSECQVMSSPVKQMEGSKGTPLSPAVLAARSMLAQRDKRCHSSKDLGAGLSWSDWGSPTGKPEWGVHTDDLSKLRKSASFGLTTMEEPDVSWVQKLLKDGPLDGDSPPNGYPVEMGCNGLRDVTDHSVLGSWMEQRRLDQIVA